MSIAQSAPGNRSVGLLLGHWTFNFLVLPDGSESIEGLMVTPDYFRVTGLKPLLGRIFAEADAPVSGPRTTIILGYDLWQRRFNGDPSVIGKSVQISRRAQPLTVVLVLTHIFLAGHRIHKTPTDAGETWDLT